MAEKIEDLVPEIEALVAEGMAAFDTPGLAIGIVAGDRLVYAKGFGVRGHGAGAVDTRTLFQIGSTTKAFLAATMAIAVDRETMSWRDRIVDLDPDFRLADPWVTREFLALDILAQRSGLPASVNDMYGILGASQAEMIASLRAVPPDTSFPSAFAYTNITHTLAARIVAERLGAVDWPEALRREILEPLGMVDTTTTLAGIADAPNHAVGHLWNSGGGAVAVPFVHAMPYAFGAAGAINSNVEDMARWLRLLLADGTFEGKRVVSAESLAVTRAPRVPIREGSAYAMGWIATSTPNGDLFWHNGATFAFGAFVGMSRAHDVGVVVLANQTHVGLPDIIGLWVLDRLLGNPAEDPVDDISAARSAAVEAEAAAVRMFAPPEDARPPIAVGSLAGDYANPVFGAARLVVGARGAELALATGARLRLDPWNGDIFTVVPVGEGEMAAVAANLGPNPLGFVQFRIDSSGRYRGFDLRFATDSQDFGFARTE